MDRVSMHSENRKHLSVRKFAFFILLGFITMAALNISISCWDSFSFEPKEEQKIDRKKIDSDASVIAKAFVNANLEEVSELLTETTLALYQDHLEEMQPYMADFGKAIKNRKLIFANEIYAVFEYSSDGRTYTFEMMLDDDGNWKLTRF